MLDTARELGPWILASVALVQVWAIGLWRRFRKGEIEIHESGMIEIGYGNYGPSVGLMGTIQAVQKDAFIKAMYVRVTRKRDRAEHIFNWRAMRSPTISLGNPDQPIEFEIPASFLLKPESPKKYNVFFNDDTFVGELNPHVSPVQDQWWDFKETRIAELRESHGAGVELMLKGDLAEDELFKEFSKERPVVDAWGRLDRAFYWDSGEYELELVVVGTRPDREWRFTWGFHLPDADADQLRTNSVGVVRMVCGLKSFFHFAYVPYESA